MKKWHEQAISALLGLGSIAIPAAVINSITGTTHSTAVLSAVLVASLVGYAQGTWSASRSTREQSERQSEEPLDSDGNYMPICKGCSAEWPGQYGYDCPEAQQ